MEAIDMVSNALLAKMKATQPHKVRVYTADDEHRDVGVPTRRRKWTHVLDVIERIPWVRCELLNKSEEVLGIVDNDGAAGEPEDIGTAPTGTRVGELRVMMEMTQRAVDRALAHRNAELSAILGMVPEVMRTVVQANTELARVYRMAAQAAGMGARAAALAEGQEGREPGSDADAIMARLALQMMTGERADVTPPNGEHKRRRADGKRGKGAADDAD